METEISCTMDDKIRCTYFGCGAVSLVKNLNFKPGHSLLNPGGIDNTQYFYCQHCHDPHAKVFDWGKGNLVLAANVELIAVVQQA